MIITAWILLCALSCCAQAMAPPVVAALEPGNRDSDHDETLSVPDKRILKYLLPSAQSWGGSGVNAPIPTGQEGTKRGYVDRNFLRFGRSDAEKRDAGRNFLRFGRGGANDYDDDDETSVPAAEKRNRNFIRFGRDSGRNFLRFGRPNLEFGLNRSPLAFAQGLEEDEPTQEEKRAQKEYLRFGRSKNFPRIGRNDNFLRFGRSVDAHTFCDDCEEENINKHSTATSSSSSSSSPSAAFPASHDEDNTNFQDEPSLSEDSDHSAAGERGIHRSKRSAPVYYDYAVLPSHGPAAWARDFQSAEEEEVETPDLNDDLQDLNKRSYNRNFLRFGRDRNFLRFGKRDYSSDGLAPSGSNMMMAPVQYPRIVRASNRNFIRFG